VDFVGFEQRIQGSNINGWQCVRDDSQSPVPDNPRAPNMSLSSMSGGYGK